MIKELLHYQEVDGELREIETKLSRSEERKRAVEAKRYLDGVEESVNKIDAKAGELLAVYQNILKDIEKLEEQREELKKAYDGIEDEVGANYLIKKMDKLSSLIKNSLAQLKTIMDEFNAIAASYISIKKKAKEEQEKYKENAQKYNEFKASFQEDKKKIEAELEKIKKKVKPELMEKYIAKRENKMYPIFYKVEGGVCGACKMELSLSEINKIKNGEIIECQCGRLLYKGE